MTTDFRPEWFRTIMDALTPDELQALKDKARWEAMSLPAVLIDWPSLAPERLRDMIPEPTRAP